MKLRSSIAALTLAVAMTACGDSSDAAGIRFYPLKEFTIVSVLDGVTKGTKTTHVRDWGNRYVTIEETTLSMMGVTRSEKKRVIVEGADVTTIDEQAKTVTRSVNPLYDNVVKNLEGKDPEEVGREFMIALGHKPTGHEGSFAGETCEVWTNAQFAQELCATDDGLVLNIVSNMMGMRISETATDVRRGDGGPASAFEVPDYPERTAPNIQDIQKMMKGG